MTILLDHCLPKRLRRLLPGYQVTTTREMRWEEFQNGELLSLAEQQFDVFLTIDKGIKHQQNMTGRTITVTTLRAKKTQSNFWLPSRRKSLLCCLPFSRARSMSWKLKRPGTIRSFGP